MDYSRPLPCNNEWAGSGGEVKKVPRLEFRVQGSKFSVQGSEFRVQSFGFKVPDSKFSVQNL